MLSALRRHHRTQDHPLGVNTTKARDTSPSFLLPLFTSLTVCPETLVWRRDGQWPLSHCASRARPTDTASPWSSSLVTTPVWPGKTT